MIKYYQICLPTKHFRGIRVCVYVMLLMLIGEAYLAERSLDHFLSQTACALFFQIKIPVIIITAGTSTDTTENILKLFSTYVLYT